MSQTAGLGSHQVRFKFGKNWQQFISATDESHIREAEHSLRVMLGRGDMHGLTFLDIGCGSGLFSLAARRLGAKVHSFDYDEESVASTASLRARTGHSERDWTIEQGSVLNADYLSRIGKFDIVYAWGVLHHTGAMWDAVVNAAHCVANGGLFAIAIYRRTPLCPLWAVEKKLYAGANDHLQRGIRGLYKAAFLGTLMLLGRNPRTYVIQYKSLRGMTWHNDVHDWLGGYPYESANAIDVTSRLEKLGLRIVKTTTRRPGSGLFGTGCDEFVAERLI